MHAIRSFIYALIIASGRHTPPGDDTPARPARNSMSTPRRVIYTLIMALAVFVATASATNELSRYAAAALGAALAWKGRWYSTALTLLLIIICMELRGARGLEYGTWLGVILWIIAALTQLWHFIAQLPPAPYAPYERTPAAPEDGAPREEFGITGLFELDMPRQALIHELRHTAWMAGISEERLQKMTYAELELLDAQLDPFGDD